MKKETGVEKGLVGGGWASKGYLQNLWIQHRLTSDGYQRLWMAQGGKCPGCQQTFAHPFVRSMESGVKPEVEKDATGRVRGLICRPCREVLKKLEENGELFQRLAVYAKKGAEGL